MDEIKKLFWRFYWYTGEGWISGMHYANTDQEWSRIFGRLLFLIDLGHEYIEVKAQVLHAERILRNG